jgi:hypothetical protein
VSDSLTLKKTTNFQEPQPQKRGLTLTLEGKLHFLIIFAVLYGLIFINYIDVLTPGGNESGYHLWLVFMYFFPFAGFSISNIKNWRLTLGLGFIASLMNDVFYGSVSYLMHTTINLSSYYYQWLIPQKTALFQMNLGFVTFSVQSWMMSASIYLRIATVCLLLKGWNMPMRNYHIPAYLAFKRQKFGSLNRVVKNQPINISEAS